MLKGAEFIKEFKARGFFYQCTDEKALIDTLNFPNIAAFIGFDATATSLHVGSLMQIMIFRLMQKYNIKPIVLIGGGTTKVGDPSFKNEARKLLADEDIAKNAEGIKKSIAKFVKFGDDKDSSILVDNAEWLDNLNYMEFLRDYGRHFSVNRMLSFDSVKSRLTLEQGLSFLEFNYMILQAYDFLVLNRQYNCVLQCGGSDQWGNIVNGIELIRRIEGKEAFGLTTPLITTASGQKMGKTEGGAVWLNEDLLSPFDYYQYWRNTEDADVFRFMRLFTDINIEQIEKYEADKATNINEYKKLLAFETTKLCHGEQAAKEAEQTAINIFEKGIVEGIEEFKLSRSILKDAIPVYELYAKVGLAESNGEARRLIRGGGAKINQNKIEDENLKISLADFKEGFINISSGKKKYLKVILVD